MVEDFTLYLEEERNKVDFIIPERNHINIDDVMSIALIGSCLQIGFDVYPYPEKDIKSLYNNEDLIFINCGSEDKTSNPVFNSNIPFAPAWDDGLKKSATSLIFESIFGATIDIMPEVKALYQDLHNFDKFLYKRGEVEVGSIFDQLDSYTEYDRDSDMETLKDSVQLAYRWFNTRKKYWTNYYVCYKFIHDMYEECIVDKFIVFNSYPIARKEVQLLNSKRKDKILYLIYPDFNNHWIIDPVKDSSGKGAEEIEGYFKTEHAAIDYLEQLFKKK